MEGNVYATPVDYVVTEKEAEKEAVGFHDALYTIGNFAPGKEADILITLHNEGRESHTLAIAYRVPSFTKEGYVGAPGSARDWLVIEEPIVVLKPREKKEIVLTMCLPMDADTPDKWEFWVAIRDTEQVGMVQTEGWVRIFVDMR